MKLKIAAFLLGLMTLSSNAEADPEGRACLAHRCQGLLVIQQTVAPAAGEAEVRRRNAQKLKPHIPAFWMQFKSYAYQQLPKHREKNFDAVWLAMPINTSDGMIATLGLKGVWW